MQQSGATTVLVVEDSETTSDLLTRLLTYSGFTVIEARSGEEALSTVKNAAIDAVLLDAELPGMDGYEVARRLRSAANVPRLPILMLTSEQDISSKLSLLDAGLDDYLTRPFGAGELIYRLQGLLSRHARDQEVKRIAVEASSTDEPEPGDAEPEPRKGFMIAGFGTKGGVGKTMIGCNLALSLVRAGRRVVLVDADFFFGDVNIHLSLPSDRSIVDLLSQIDTLDEYAESALAEHPSGLYALLGPTHPEDAERITAEHVQRIIDWLRSRFDVVIVDCPPAYDDRVLTVLENVDAILLVVTPEIGPLKNMSQFLDLAETIGFSRANIYVVLNRSDSNVGIEAKMIERTVRHKVAFRVPSGGRAVVLSVNRGQPIVLNAPRHPVAQQIKEMGDFFTSRLAEHRQTAR